MDAKGATGTGARRLLTVGMSVVLGTLVGALGTAVHQATYLMVPVGLVLASVLLVSTLLWWALRTRSLLAVGVASVSMFVVVALLSSAGGDSILVPGNGKGYIWTIGAPVLAALVLVGLARARRPRRPAQAPAGTLESK